MERSTLSLDEDQRRVLVSWVRAGTTPQRVAMRARIVLLANEGSSARQIARRLGISTRTVAVWFQRFGSGGPQALLSDAPGRGRKPTVTMPARSRLVELLATSPPQGQRWTVRTLAAALGISRASVHRMLRAQNGTS
jgi:transposase